MKAADLPPGIYKACSGIVGACVATEPYASAIKTAEHAVGGAYADEHKRQQLVKAVKLHLADRKAYPTKRLRAVYGFTETGPRFLWEVQRYAHALALELGLIEKNTQEDA